MHEPPPVGRTAVRLSRRRVLGLAGLALGGLTRVLQAAPVRAHEVKAAFLVNFVRFVTWPESAFPDARTEVGLGVLGDDPILDSLRSAAVNQTAQGRLITVRRLSEADDVTSLHALYFSRSVGARTEGILSRLAERPILTVGEGDTFIRSGGIIAFTTVEDRVRFDINAEQARQAQLHLSSKLLALARTVHGP